MVIYSFIYFLYVKIANGVSYIYLILGNQRTTVSFLSFTMFKRKKNNFWHPAECSSQDSAVSAALSCKHLSSIITLFL